MNDKTHKNDYQLLLGQLKAIPPEEVFPPRKPVDIASQEGFDLSSWAAHDREALEGAGLDWALVESLPVRTGALPVGVPDGGDRVREGSARGLRRDGR